MIVDIFKGFLTGMCASMPLGPVAILVFQKTLSKGRKAGFLTGMGACTIDTMYATIAVFALAFAQKIMDEHQVLILLAGGLIVGVLGVRMATSNPFRKMTATSSHSVSAKDYFKAVAMALSNPGAILVMFALFAFFDIDTSSSDKMSIAPILFAVSAGSATYWFAMTSLINHFRKKFQISTMVWMNRIAGSIIAIIGLVLLGEGLFKVLVQGVPII